MNTDSSIFDAIRVKPKKKKVEKSAPSEAKPQCQWDGCESAGTHRAPKGRGHEGDFLHFCMQHVREYNKSYNYFQGLDDSQVQTYHDDAVTGHRPTWKMGVNRATMESEGRRPGEWSELERDAVEKSDSISNPEILIQRRHLVPAQKHAFETLKLSYYSESSEIKARYKELVKKHHPDANDGDSSLEDRLRQIIQAYNVLKKAGFC